MINASNYVCATTLENLVLAKGATGPVLDHSASMLAEIERRCGADVAMLFAQPTIKSTTGSAVVSWYAAPDGSPRPLASFDAIGQRPFTEILRARLARLLPVMADPVIGASIGAALNIRSFQDIYVMGRDVVIVNWGMLPRDVVSSKTAREAHFRSTLGSFAPSHFPIPPFDFNDAEHFTDAVARELKASAGRDAAEARDTAVVASQAPKAPSRPAEWTSAAVPARKHRRWIAPLVASVLAGVLLGVLLMPGVLQYATVVSPDVALIDQQRRIVQEVNRSLEQQITALKSNSAVLVCRALPGATNVTFASPNLLPPPAQSIPVSAPTPGGPTNAGELAEKAVVQVRAQFGDSGSIGTAFFISDKLLVTNDRLVSGPGGRDPVSVTIENKALGKRVPAKILARTHAKRPGDADLALLEVSANTSLAFLRPAEQPQAATAVRSAGFPGLNLDSAGIPEAVVTDGIVSKPMDVNGQNLVAHSAATAQGTSGGPLMDLCGRAVGVNSYYDTGASIGFSLAQPIAALLDFLKANGKNVAPDDTPCAPRGVAFGGPAAASPATSAPSGPQLRPRG